jgi:O-methyltransferase domain/Dimerisation domain
MDGNALPPRRVLAHMLVGNQIQQALHVAAKLGIADVLRDGAMRCDVIARATGAHVESLYRLLRVLASFGVFAEDDEHRFHLTPLGALLQTGTPDSMRTFALWSGAVSYQTFGGLEYSVRTGKPAFEHIFGLDFYRYLNEHCEVGSLFDELMSWNTAPVAPLVAARDFRGVEVVVDVAGGRGELVSCILRTHPAIRGVLVDQPRAIKGAAVALQAAGVGDRCALVCGDVLESVPAGGDVYLLKSVAHGLDDEEAVRLLRNCGQAMNDGGRLMLVEFIMPPGNDPFPAKLMDLLMLVGCNGRERSENEFRGLLDAAGFRMTDVVPTKFGYSLIEGAVA